MAADTWQDIAKALADAKLTAINDALTAASSDVQLRMATHEVPDDLPSMLPCLLVFPPTLEMTEEGQNEFYEATFGFVIPFDRPGTTWQVLDRVYDVLDAVYPAFRTGRQLGLAPTVINSYLRVAGADVLTEWDESERTVGIRGEAIVSVRRTVKRTP